MESENITKKIIESYFLFKNEARLIRDVVSATQLAERCQIPIDLNQLDLIQPADLRKVLVRAYSDQYIAHSDTEQTHFESMLKKTKELTKYLSRWHFQGALWVGGSFANGKPNGIYSDLDLYFGLDSTISKTHAWEVLGGLSEVGIVISDRSKAERDINKIAQTSKGVARVNAMTTNGIDVDIHCLGKIDLERMGNLYPGKINRLEAVKPYTQVRVNFIGQKKEVEVDTVQIKNYFTESVPIKGIYLDNLSCGGVLVYEHKGFGTNVANCIWKAIVKGYLFYSNAYVRNEQGRVTSIDNGLADFGGFLKTLYYQKEANYSEKRLRFLQAKYTKTLVEIADRYNLEVITK